VNILVIMGSPRKGNTYRAVQQIESAMQALGDVEFEYLMLKDANLAQCLGCFVCFDRGEEHCPNKDDASEIEEKMQKADGVIFATPVYGMNVSGLFKTFVDRLAYIFHRPRFFDKKALLVSTTGALGLKDVLDYLDLVAGVWGFEVVERVGLITPPLPQAAEKVRDREEKIDSAARAFYEAVLRKTRRSPSFNDIMIFRGQRATFGELKEQFPVDYAYWKERGWLDRGRKYFVDVPVNPLYNAIGRVAEWMIRRQVRRDLQERW
jgi:multimeric flavodoxin WrbA